MNKATSAPTDRFAFSRPCWAVCALAGLLVALTWLALRPASTPTAATVGREMLLLRDGRLYCQGESHPFTGLMTEGYATGALKSRSAVSNGLLEGLSEGWYTNGQKQVEERFHAGVSHGLRTKWHENGRKLSEATVVEGKIEGVFRRWHENGSPADEIAMKAGQPDGPSRAYYPSGCLKAEVTLLEGQVRQQYFWRDGEQSGAVLARTDGPAIQNH